MSSQITKVVHQKQNEVNEKQPLPLSSLFFTALRSDLESLTPSFLSSGLRSLRGSSPDGCWAPNKPESFSSSWNELKASAISSLEGPTEGASVLRVAPSMPPPLWPLLTMHELCFTSPPNQ